MREEARLRRKYLLQTAQHVVLGFVSLAVAATISTEMTFGTAMSPAASADIVIDSAAPPQ